MRLVALSLLAAFAGVACGSEKAGVASEDPPAATTIDKTRPGAHVRFVAGALAGETGVVRGRTPDIPHELYDIVLDKGGDVVSAAPDRFELVR